MLLSNAAVVAQGPLLYMIKVTKTPISKRGKPPFEYFVDKGIKIDGLSPAVFLNPG
jgi:hypothetical protein